MSHTGRETKAVMTSDGRLPIEQPDGSHRPAPAGRTDRARVDAMTDEEITANALADPDAQPLDDEFWRTAEIVKVPVAAKRHTGLRIDADVLDWFKGQGRGGWQTRINAVLRAYYEHQRAKDRQPE